MQLSENDFKKFLVDEIIRSSNNSVKAALEAVNEFSKDELFKKSYLQWKYLKRGDKKYYSQPPTKAKSMRDIIFK